MKIVWHGRSFRVRKERKDKSKTRHRITVPVGIADEIPADAEFKPTLQHNGDLLYERQ